MQNPGPEKNLEAYNFSKLLEADKMFRGHRGPSRLVKFASERIFVYQGPLRYIFR